MSKKCRESVILITICVCAVVPGCFARSRPKTINANLTFLAESTFFRTTWGWNSDTYLAELSAVAPNESQLVRIVDDYANWSAPLSHQQLTASTGSMLKVYRDAQCDLPFGQILLRAAPGDLAAVLPERITYIPALERTPTATAKMPCYRVLRK